MAQGKSLEELRREIDAIDDALHDLLMHRTRVTGAIAKTKPRAKGGIPLALAMRPAREAEIMRRCAARHRGDLPIATVIHVLRQVLTASLAAQVPFKLHVFGAKPEFAELARAYFGARTPATLHPSESRVLNACAQDANSLGIVPLPETGGEAWWARLAPAGSGGPRVVAKLPFLAGGMSEPTALVIAAIEQEDSGDDTTLLLAEIAPSLSRMRLQVLLKENGIGGPLMAGDSSEHRNATPMLIAAEGYVAPNDERLAAFCGAAGTSVTYIVPVGGYANPVTVKEKELAQ